MTATANKMRILKTVCVTGALMGTSQPAVHADDGETRAVDALLDGGSYTGKVFQCRCGDRFVDREELARHVKAVR